MTNRLLPRRLRPLTIAALLAVTACSGGDDPTTASTPVDGAVDATDPSDTSGVSSDSTDATNQPQASTTAEPAPEPTTTSSTTTTTVPLRATVTTTEIANRSEASRLDDLRGYAVTTGEIEVSHFAAAIRTEPGTEQRAATFSTENGRTFNRLQLDDGGALESSAEDVAVDGTTVIVGGTTIAADGAASAAIWTRDDATSFGAPVRPIDRASRLIALERDAGVTYALLGTLDGDDQRDPYTFVMAVGVDGNGWTEFAFDVAKPVGGDVTVLDGNVAVVLTTEDESGIARVETWNSTDSGATFARTEAQDLTDLDAVGPLNVIDGRIRAVARPIDDGAPVVITSSDGLSWSANAPDLGEPIRTENFSPGPIEDLDIDSAIADYFFGYTSELARVALPSTGSFLQPASNGDIWFSPRPMALNGNAFIVGENARSFIAVNDMNTAIGGPAIEATGPMPTSVDLDLLAAGPSARVSTYPNVVFGDEGRFSYSSESDRAELSDGTWSLTPDVTPDELTSIVSSGAVDLAYGGTDDPADDDRDGPAFGTSFSVRTDGGAWSEPELLLTGPGGDSVNDVIAIDGGFLLAGVAEVNNGDGTESATPILKEYGDGVWIDLPVEVDLGDRVFLNRLGASDSGVRFVSGSYFDGERFQTVFLSPDESGTWVVTSLPTETTDIDIFEVRGGADAVELYTREDNEFFRYASADGSEFDRTTIVFDELYPTITEVVEIDDRTLIVGTRGGLVSSTLTVWELHDDGTTEPIELDGAPTGTSVEVDDAIVIDGTILVGGTHLRQSVAWSITLD